jgi:hypothetical protein
LTARLEKRAARSRLKFIEDIDAPFQIFSVVRANIILILQYLRQNENWLNTMPFSRLFSRPKMAKLGIGEGIDFTQFGSGKQM